MGWLGVKSAGDHETADLLIVFNLWLKTSRKQLIMVIVDLLLQFIFIHQLHWPGDSGLGPFALRVKLPRTWSGIEPESAAL